MKFNDVIKSIVKLSGGSIDKIKLEKFTEAFNHSFILTPWNYWLGVRIQKNPLDLMILQEIMFEKKPDTIIECGTYMGGSSYFMAGLMDLMKIDGRIITIEREEYQTQAHPKTDLMNVDGKIVTVNYDVYQKPTHPKIEYIHSDCLNADIPKLGARTMVILDCDHSADHVYQELQKFSPMVTLGQYIIVEDTDAHGEGGGGPANAVRKFLSNNKNFIVDKSREKYGISSNLGGYLLKVS